MDFRIGSGFDVHAFAENRKLIVGGLEIPFSKGLLGHSDADVLLHAITDALLGSLALGDIGKHFPDTDEKYKDVSSVVLLKNVVELINKKGYKVNNIDAVIMAERPKFSVYIDAMRDVIAGVCGVNIDRVSVKATTCEKLGFVGREEGIASQAVATVVKNDELF